MSLRIDSRKNRSSSTTDTNDAFGIGLRQFSNRHASAPNNVVASTCEFHNVRNDTAGAMPTARKLWFMPGAELSKPRATSSTEQCDSA
jgi:hypothetical protein